jgi:RHS repeat-associated protein
MGYLKLTYQNFEPTLKVVYKNGSFEGSTVQRFLSVDPLASERSWMSPYNFVQNNPINRVDPDGALDEWVGSKNEDGSTSWKWDENVNSYEEAVDKYGEDALYTETGHQYTSTNGDEMVLGHGEAYKQSSYLGGAYTSSNPDYPIYSKDNPPVYPMKSSSSTASSSSAPTLGFSLMGAPQMTLGALTKIPLHKTNIVKRFNLAPVKGFKNALSYTNIERVFRVRSYVRGGNLAKYWGSSLMRSGSSLSGVGFGLDVGVMLLDFNSYQNSSSYIGLGNANQFNYQNIGPSPIGGLVSDWWNSQTFGGQSITP